VDLTLDQPDVARAWTLLRLLRSEFNALAFAEQLENGAADGAAMKEVLNSSLIADEPETFVDQEPCDCAGRHARVLRLFTTCCKVQEIQHLLRYQVANGASVGASPYEVKAASPTTSRRNHLPAILFFLFVVVFVIRIRVVAFGVLVFVKVFIINDFVVFVVQKEFHGAPDGWEIYSLAAGFAADGAVAGGGGGAGATGVLAAAAGAAGAAPGCEG
jgi:hypothetical protein